MTVNEVSLDSSSESIALALSGGGARAMAFHLGCLRALHDLGILQRVSTITAVSGGSVLAGLYCSHPGDFEDFEARVREVLRQGFVVPALKRMATSLDGVKAAAYATALTVERSVAIFFRPLFKLLRLWSRSKKLGERWPNSSPFLRKASRTTILRSVFSETFRGVKLKDLRRDRPDLIVIACELRAKAAFYYTRESLHCWRYGAVKSDGVELADAVIASAAYPAALPALDQRWSFLNDKGVLTPHRVTLTDGGVYDNLGLAPLWPKRDSPKSLPVASHDRIIACRAGYGLDVTEPSSVWMSRMGAAFESVFARAQNLATNRLFDLENAKIFKGVLLPYLGQEDRNLKFPPPGLVSREETAGYPTNFKAMDEKWIELLVKRGEQIVYAQIKEHWQSYMSALLVKASV